MQKLTQKRKIWICCLALLLMAAWLAMPQTCSAEGGEYTLEFYRTDDPDVKFIRKLNIAEAADLRNGVTCSIALLERNILSDPVREARNQGYQTEVLVNGASSDCVRYYESEMKFDIFPSAFTQADTFQITILQTWGAAGEYCARGTLLVTVDSTALRAVPDAAVPEDNDSTTDDETGTADPDASDPTAFAEDSAAVVDDPTDSAGTLTDSTAADTLEEESTATDTSTLIVPVENTAQSPSYTKATASDQVLLSDPLTSGSSAETSDSDSHMTEKPVYAAMGNSYPAADEDEAAAPANTTAPTAWLHSSESDRNTLSPQFQEQERISLLRIPEKQDPLSLSDLLDSSLWEAQPRAQDPVPEGILSFPASSLIGGTNAEIIRDNREEAGLCLVLILTTATAYLLWNRRRDRKKDLRTEDRRAYGYNNI